MSAPRITWMRSELRISLRLLATAWLLALVLVLLSACGGGGDDDESKDSEPVDCKARPEQCA